jgi:hypothetical protein
LGISERRETYRHDDGIVLGRECQVSVCRQVSVRRSTTDNYIERKEAVMQVEGPTDGFVQAGIVSDRGLNILPNLPAAGRLRHLYGEGPFARLVMPPLPAEPGLYLWALNGEVVYVGQTRKPLRARLGPNGYASISLYNTYARQPGRTNGGQQTNCRVNALANAVLASGGELVIWYRVTAAENAASAEAAWMQRFTKPIWNRRIEREVASADAA